MNKLVKEIYDLANQINHAQDTDEVLKLKPYFDKKINQFINETGDGLTSLYSFENTTLTQQYLIDDAVVRVAESLVDKGLIDKTLLGDFFPRKE